MSQLPTQNPGLAQFLSEEVRADYYADFLLDQTEAALRGESPPGASGNAYYVTFAPDDIAIQHHYVTDWPVVHVAPAGFMAALRAWRQTLPSG